MKMMMMMSENGKHNHRPQYVEYDHDHDDDDKPILSNRFDNLTLIGRDFSSSSSSFLVTTDARSNLIDLLPPLLIAYYRPNLRLFVLPIALADVNQKTFFFIFLSECLCVCGDARTFDIGPDLQSRSLPHATCSTTHPNE